MPLLQAVTSLSVLNFSRHILSGCSSRSFSAPEILIVLLLFSLLAACFGRVWRISLSIVFTVTTVTNNNYQIKKSNVSKDFNPVTKCYSSFLKPVTVTNCNNTVTNCNSNCNIYCNTISNYKSTL
jgi:hypothetical protein